MLLQYRRIAVLFGEMSMPFEQACALITAVFPDIQLRSQPISDWHGPFPLPVSVIDYYTAFGPDSAEIPGYGNPYFLPRLAELWSFQAGYRYHGHTHKSLPDWNDDWIVIADAGGDPFLCSRATNQVAYARHGIGTWKPIWLFDTIESTVTCLLVLASVQHTAGDDFTDEEGYIQERYRQIARTQLRTILRSDDATDQVLAILEWTVDG
jgi:hypothetical protein